VSLCAFSLARLQVFPRSRKAKSWGELIATSLSHTNLFLTGQAICSPIHSEQSFCWSPLSHNCCFQAIIFANLGGMKCYLNPFFCQQLKLMDFFSSLPGPSVTIESQFLCRWLFFCQCLFSISWDTFKFSSCCSMCCNVTIVLAMCGEEFLKFILTWGSLSFLDLKIGVFQQF
jgi:hypothetical protein